MELGNKMPLQIYIHDVGHGQAVHAFTPNGQSIVIDLGCSAEFSPLEWLRDITPTIDQLIITHPHGDHIDELLLVEKLGFKVRQLWRPKWLSKEQVYSQNQSSYSDKLDTYFVMSDRFSSAIKDGELVGNAVVSGGVSIEKFSSKSCGHSNINNHSGVIKIEHEGVSVIIPGDNEPPSWRELMKQPKFVDAMANANVFMASHHGRESGYCPDIFFSKPNLCVVSDGRVQETDARSRYSYHAMNWDVRRRSINNFENRACVTTRCDGYIHIEIGSNSNGKGYLSVAID